MFRTGYSSPLPFFLSKVNNKVLTKISTQLILPSLYTAFRASVNKKVSEISDLLFPFDLSYNTYLKNHSRSLQMLISDSYILILDTHMSNFGFSDNSIHRYIKLISRNDPNKILTFCIKDLSKFLRLEKSQTSDFLKKCQNFNLLKRHYDTSNTGKRKIGNTLHLELTPPTLLGTEERIANDESQLSLTFTGTVAQKIETKYHDKKVVDVELSNVRSESGHVIFDKYWVKQEDISDPNSIKVQFKASLKIITDTRLILVPVKYQHHA